MAAEMTQMQTPETIDDDGRLHPGEIKPVIATAAIERLVVDTEVSLQKAAMPTRKRRSVQNLNRLTDFSAFIANDRRHGDSGISE